MADEQPYLLTFHDEEGNEETYSFATMAERDAFLEQHRAEGIEGPTFQSTKAYEDYITWRAENPEGGIFFEYRPDGLGVHCEGIGKERLLALAEEAGLDPQTYLQQMLNKTAGKHIVRAQDEQGPLTRQQRRLQEREQARRSRRAKGRR